VNTGRIDWSAAAASLDASGFAAFPPVLTESECGDLASLYADDTRFRSRIEMERFRFGVGEYKYFAAPLPAIVQTLREELYARLAPIANQWTARLQRGPGTAAQPDPDRPATNAAARSLQGRRLEYPPVLDDYLARCHEAGQRRPTPLVLKYEAGGYNCLHQDLYGELAFPLQVVFLLSRPDVDFTGGEFLLVEQRPRAQSRGHAIRIEQGGGVIFAVRERPVAGSRGDYRTVMRHGVSTILSGRRYSLGIIFHDAK
jgi:uncharacterized protein